jgi:hypothetical protein
MATASATRTFVLTHGLMTDSKRVHTKLGGESSEILRAIARRHKSRRTLGRGFSTRILAHQCNCRRINCYLINYSSLRLLVLMVRNRDVRLRDFYPLVHPSAFGQSVKQTGLSNPGPFGCSRSEDSLFSTTKSIQCSCHSVPGATAAASEGVVCVRAVKH